MHLRRDALAAAAEWITGVESAVKAANEKDDPELVATVGKIALKPNAGNVIPGEVSVSLDVRHISNRALNWWTKELVGLARAVAGRRGIELEWALKSGERVIDMDRYLGVRLDIAVEKAGFPLKYIHSGAGHDAMVMAARLPTAMLFLRSPGGVSHHPDENVRVEDVEAALRVGGKLLEHLAAEVG